MGQDNRKHERFPVRLRCWCEGENVTFYARVANISEGGIFLRTSTPLPAGARAHLRFGSNGPAVLETEATVAWARQGTQEDGPPGMGLKFEPIDGGILSALRKIISEQEGKK